MEGNKLLLDILKKMVLVPVTLHPKAPPMPSDRSPSKIPCIPFTPRSERFLKTVVPIEKSEFEALVGNYLDALPPIGVPESEVHHFALPHPKTIMCPKWFHTDIDWNQYTSAVLNATRALVHLVDSSSIGYGLGADDHGELLCGWYNMNWGKEHPTQPRLVTVELVTVTMPAWCFGERDMLDFTNAKSFVNPGSSEEASKTSAATKLWARLHDFCYLHDAHYFLVTTYNQWTFGCFSSLWSTGYVAPAMKFDATTPNVVQSVMCWIHSAHGHSKGYRIPKVLAEENEIKLNQDKDRTGKRKAVDDREGEKGWKRRKQGDTRRAFGVVPWLTHPQSDGTTRQQESAASSPPLKYDAEFMRFEALSSAARAAFAVAFRAPPTLDHPQRPELATSPASAANGDGQSLTARNFGMGPSTTGANVQADLAPDVASTGNPAWFFPTVTAPAAGNPVSAAQLTMPVAMTPTYAYNSPTDVAWPPHVGRDIPYGVSGPITHFPEVEIHMLAPGSVFQQQTVESDAPAGSNPNPEVISMEL